MWWSLPWVEDSTDTGVIGVVVSSCPVSWMDRSVWLRMNGGVRVQCWGSGRLLAVSGCETESGCVSKKSICVGG